MQSFKFKFTEANTRKMDTKFACKNPHFDFHAGQLTRDIVFQKSRHSKTIHTLLMTRVVLIFPRVDEIRTAHWVNSKNSREPPSEQTISKVLSLSAHTKHLIIRNQNYQKCLIFSLYVTNNQNLYIRRPHTRATGLRQYSQIYQFTKKAIDELWVIIDQYQFYQY